jgi:tetratricopeptide (TPR) repeat protein
LSTILERALTVGHNELSLATLQVLAELAAEAGSMDQLLRLQAKCEGLVTSADAELAGRAALSLGFMSLARGEFSRAEKFFREASEHDRTRQTNGPVGWRLLSGLSLAQTSLGDYAGAEVTLAQLEESTRAVPGEQSPILWSNIAVFHQETGRFRKAADYFARAIHALPDFPSPKDHAVVLSSAASFAMDLGYSDLADECLLRAEAAIGASRVARDRLDTLLVRADFHLVKREYELTWMLMQEEILPMGTRTYAIGESARHERLTRHALWAIAGPTAYAEAKAARDQVIARLPLHGRVELDCFDDWISSRSSQELARQSHALLRAIAGGFSGAVLHLAAIGCLPETELVAPHDNSIVRQLAARQPALFREQVPEGLDWTLPAFL